MEPSYIKKDHRVTKVTKLVKLEDHYTKKNTLKNLATEIIIWDIIEWIFKNWFYLLREHY